jgi:hypothetical protein
MKKILITFIMLIALISVSASPVYALGEITGPDIIYKENNEIVSITDIKALYSSSGGAIIVEEDGFTGKGHIPGEKTVLLKATDGFAEKTKEITIIVTYNKIPDDGTDNLFKMVGKTSDSFVFVTNVSKTVTIEKMRDTLISLGLLSVVEPSSKNIILDEYTENKTETGSYTLNFRIMDATGQIKTFYTTVIVLGSNGEWEDLTPSTPSWNFNFDFITIGLGIIASIVTVGLVIFFSAKAYQYFNKKVRRGG